MGTPSARFRGAGHRLPDRGGAALLDALIAVLVASVGLLAGAGMIQQSLATAARARWLYVSVSATRDVADSLALVGTRGAGSRSLLPVTVRWSPEGGRLYRFEAFAPDTSAGPTLVIHADIPPPIP